MKSLRWVPALVLAALACAPGAEAQKAQPRIIAGSDVSITTYPFQVALYRDNFFRCGGSILDSTTVITAAHCVTTQASPHAPLNGDFTVGYGSDLRSAQASATVSSMDILAQYTNPLVSQDESYDVAILHLGSAIDLTGPTASAIPVANSAQPKDIGTAVVTGWGDTSPGGSSSQTLKGTRVPLLPDQPCTDEFGAVEYQPVRAVCAGGGSLPANNPDTCQGDSGGPLVVDLDSSSATNFALLGLTSFGHGCGAQDTPAVYTYVQGTGVASFINASTYQTTTVTTGDFESGTPGARASTGGASGGGFQAAPVLPAPPPGTPATPATRDTTRPTAKVSKLSCTKKRKCSFKVAAADKGGTVKKFSATVTRKVRTCRSRGDFRVCSTTTRKKTLKPKRVSGGFTFSATLVKASYKLTAVATDAAGNRSRAVSKTFRVR